jgi:hypothetical protein
MSARAQLAAAARVVVLLMAPALMWMWTQKMPHWPHSAAYDLPAKLLAAGLALIGAAPLLTRVRRPPFRDDWTVFDLLLFAGMLGVFVFILSGEGRAFVTERWDFSTQ